MMNYYYTGTTEISAYGGIVTDNLLEIAEYAANNSYHGFCCESFNSQEQAYWYLCNEIVKMRWCENYQGAYPMPSIDLFAGGGVYTDNQQIDRLPNWVIKLKRYFAIITLGGASGLAEEINGLVGMLTEMNGMPVKIKEFPDIGMAQNWIGEQICTSLLTMGAYIQILSPITIPEPGQIIPAPSVKLLNDIPSLNNSLELYHGDNKNIIDGGTYNGQ